MDLCPVIIIAQSYRFTVYSAFPIYSLTLGLKAALCSKQGCYFQCCFRDKSFKAQEMKIVCPFEPDTIGKLGLTLRFF